ncbi:MAG: hypothetical protein IPL88_09405 [Rhizobiales bacterium]|nr:hypothetical protein [Hyphomicrobiales bacterium]
MRAFDTSGRGTGAPAETKTRSVGVDAPVAMQGSARSLRKGVAPIVKVAPSCVIWFAITAGAKMSRRIAVAPNIGGGASP